MKHINFKRILKPIGKTFMAFATIAALNACDNVIYDYEDNCDPEPGSDVVDPLPEPEVGYIRIYVRSNPGGGGKSAVWEAEDTENYASTEEGAYVSIDIPEDTPYTLKATETNNDYIFVGWHDDTNDGDLTPGRSLIENLKSDESTRYTAIFKKVEEIEEPEPGLIRIYVRSNPGGGGTSSVTEDEDNKNTIQTEEGLYVGIDIEINSPYTLEAFETNPGYRFVRWHDDTNNGDLTDRKMKIPSIKSESTMRYTAIFEKIDENDPNNPDDPNNPNNPNDPNDPNNPNNPGPDEGNSRIFVRVNPSGGGTGQVSDDSNSFNFVYTTEGVYEYIDVAENGSYSLKATESNIEYRFVKWHDDTHNVDFTEGELEIPGIKSEGNVRYTAIFEKIEEPKDPEEGFKRIYVRVNPGNSGTAAVSDDSDTNNSTYSKEGIYESIQVAEDGTYTLKASETNPEYKFVKWHDDTNDSDLSEGMLEIKNIKGLGDTKYTAIFEKIENENPNNPNEPNNPNNPTPTVKNIYVRVNPGGGGTAAVTEKGKTTNTASTNEGMYVNIELPINGTYTLTATESNAQYRFVRWHDDTNDGDLTEGKLEIDGISSPADARYTAIFEKIEQPSNPQEPAPTVKHVYVRVNPGNGGTAAVAQADKTTNAISTNEGLYVSIELPQSGVYNLTATETNDQYKFVRWHDDTNNGDLTEGKKDISGISSTGDARYTAIFELKNQQPSNPDQPGTQDQGKYVKFVFEKNMQFVDGFSNKVKSVDLYVFDNNGKFIKKYQEYGTALKSSDYLMDVSDLPAGTYEFIAWCGLYNNSGHFTVASGVTKNTDATCKMATTGGVQSQNLNDLYHGRETNATYTDNSTQKQIQTVYLTKDTNNINITLQHKLGLEFPKDQYEVTLTDRNDYMQHDNKMHANVQNVTYKPHHTVYGSTRSRSTRAENLGNYLQVELSTARLMTGNNPIITVRDTKTDKIIFSIPLVKWATQLRSAQSKRLIPDDQDYLDREDNYNLMLWLDSSDDQGWFGAQVEINDWHVIDDSANAK